jgi:hypothetical protein
MSALTAFFAPARPTSRPSSETVELFDIDHKKDGATDWNFYRVRNKGARRRRFERHHVYQLFSTLAVTSYYLVQGWNFRFLDADQYRRISFSQKSAGGPDYREFESVFNEFASDSVAIATMNDTYGKLQPFDYNLRSPRIRREIFIGLSGSLELLSTTDRYEAGLPFLPVDGDVNRHELLDHPDRG